MKVGHLIYELRRFNYDAEVYVYDETRDQEREIESVGAANEMMAPGAVINIRAAKLVIPS